MCKEQADEDCLHLACQGHPVAAFLEQRGDPGAGLPFEDAAEKRQPWKPWYALHDTGYWTGDDVYTQLNHAITIFEILHPGCKGAFLFDNSTGHSKMPEDALALLAQNMNSGPGGKRVSRQRGTTWQGSDGVEHPQSFVFAAGDVFMFDASVRALPLDAAGDVAFPAGCKVEVKRPGERKWSKDAKVVSRQAGGKITVSIEVAGRAEVEVLEGVDASALQVPVETFPSTSASATPRASNRSSWSASSSRPGPSSRVPAAPGRSRRA